VSAQGVPIATAAIRLVGDATGLGSDIVRKATPEIAKANRTLSEHSQLLGAGSASARDFRRGILAATLSVAGLRGAVLAAGTGFLGGAGLINAMKAFIGLSAQFEKSMNQFQAVTHATSGELRQAREEAIALGRDIRLPQTSAADAAEAMTELARGGLDVTQSMSAARGSLQLAAAAGSDFASAAAIQARALNAFALSGDQAVRVADVLANTANISSGEIQDFALALQQASAVAHAANFSIEDTAAALAELANAGLTGSDAGTSLRTMILRLIPQTTKAKEEMKQLGVATTDANGEFLPLTEIIRRYNVALQRLSPEQRNLALQTIFGQDAIRASNILFSSGTSIFDRYRAAVSRSGAAAEFAAARNKGLSGTFDALRSNVESIIISVGQATLPGLTNFVSGINESITGLQQSDQAVKTLQTSADALFRTFHAVGDAVTAIGPPLALFARGAADLANFVGGAGIVTFIAGIKLFPAALKAAAGAQTRFVAATQILNGELQVTRRTNEEVAAGARRLGTINTELADTQVALFESQNALAAGTAKVAEAEQAAAGAASEMSAAQVASNEAMLAGLTAQERYIGGLTGMIAAEEGVAKAARDAAIAQGLQATTLEKAIVSQKAAVAAQAAVALPQQRAGPGFGFASTVEKQNAADLLALEAGLDRELVAAELSAGKFKRTLNSIGTTALTAIGGEVGALIIGFSVLGVVIKKLIDSSENEFDRLKRSTEGIGNALTEVTTATDDLTRARGEVRSDRIAVDEAKLNVRYAEGAVQTARASGNAQDLKSAQVQLERATTSLTSAQQAYAEAVERSARAQIALADASRTFNQQQQDEIDNVRAAFEKALTREAQVPQTLAQSRQKAQNEIIKILDADIKQQTKFNPLFAHQLQMIKEFIQLTGNIPSDQVFRLIFRVRSVTDTTQTPGGLLLGETQRARRAGLTAVEDARSQMEQHLRALPEKLSPLARFAGTKAGEAYAEALAEGIRTKQSVAAAAATRAVREVRLAGQREIDQSILGAESNLISIGSNISEQIAQLIDQGPLGQRVKKLQDELDKARRAAQRLELVQGLRDASRDLQRAREQLESAPDTGLTAAQRRQQRESTQDFLRPFQERRQQAAESLKEFTTEGIIAQLQKAQQAQKDAVVKGIGNVIAAFAAGKIKADDAISQLAKIIGGAKHQNNFKNAGKNLGQLFVLGFGGAVQSLFEQIGEIGKVSPAARARAGTPRPDVERPAETIARVRQQILDAEEKRRVALVNNTTEITKLKDAILLALGQGKSPGKAQAAAAKGAKGRVVFTPPPPRGLRGNR
jgi:TP901 family phage tail tape measure protein